MDSFAIVYFKEDRSYSAVAVALLKAGGQKLTKGSQVTVLDSSFDPVTNAEKDEEWPATIVKFGSERELKHEVPRFNKKARHYEEQESLKAPRKRKANPKYKDNVVDENEDNGTVHSEPSKSIKRKQHAVQPLSAKNVVYVENSDSESSDCYQEDGNAFLKRITEKALKPKKSKMTLRKQPTPKPEHTHEDNNNQYYRSKYMELQLQMRLQQQLQREDAGRELQEREVSCSNGESKKEETLEEIAKERKRQQLNELEKRSEKERIRRENEKHEREERERKALEVKRKEREGQQHEEKEKERKRREQEQQEKEKRKRKGKKKKEEERRKRKRQEQESLEQRRKLQRKINEREMPRQEQLSQPHSSGEKRDDDGIQNERQDGEGRFVRSKYRCKAKLCHFFICDPFLYIYICLYTW